jgi:GNAT superfamily N-acetyltransferase
MTIELRELTPEVREDLRSVRLGAGQDRFVSTIADSLAEAEEFPQANPWFRGVYAEGQAVGFVMISWDCPHDPPNIFGPWFLWKLIIDERQQRRGLGREVVLTIADLVRAQGGQALLVSYVDEPGGPRDFYLGLGFRPTGEVDDEGEILLSLAL